MAFKALYNIGSMTPSTSYQPMSPSSSSYPPARVPSPVALALFAAILLDTVTEILEVLVSGRLGGVLGGESWFRLLVIIREAAVGRKGEPSGVGAWKTGLNPAVSGSGWRR